MTDLHIFIDDKSVARSCMLLRRYFSAVNNPIVIIGKKYGYDYSAFENLTQLPDTAKGRRELRRFMKNADRIHCHGLFHVPTIVYLAMHPKVARKTVWGIWGHDLYSLIYPHKELKWKIVGIFRRLAVKNIGSVSTNVEGDCRLLEETMGRKYRYFKTRFSPAAVANVYEMVTGKKDGTLNILLGNSATVSNRHREAIDALVRFADHDMRVYVPLSYGNNNYRDSVIAYGREKLGDKFVPMVDFMPHEDYYKFLATIDVAVFAHDRQQAIGNIMPLLYAGKKVYIRSDISTWDCLVGEYGLKMFDYLKLSDEDFDSFAANPTDVKEQQALINEMTDEAKYVEAYRKTLISEE